MPDASCVQTMTVQHLRASGQGHQHVALQGRADQRRPTVSDRAARLHPFRFAIARNSKTFSEFGKSEADDILLFVT